MLNAEQGTNRPMSEHSAFSNQHSALRLVVMGTGPFAMPFFRALYDTRHSIVALVTQPLRPAVGKKAPPPAPMRDVAAEHDTPIYDPPSINTEEARYVLGAYQPDLFVV